MIERIIEWSVRNRFLVLLALLGVVLWGVFALYNTPLDAIPDLSDNQVIVYAPWPGRSPQVIEDQVTYPLETSLQGLPGVKTVRASSAVGFSMIYVIFKDGTNLYFDRTEVLERLTTLQGQLPQGVTPALGPEGTGVGQVFWYSLSSKTEDLGSLRALQDWYLKPQLQSVAGVAEVASAGGYVREYQIELDPNKLYSFGVTLNQVVRALKASNDEVGGGLINQNGAEYLIRGEGYVTGLDDLARVAVKAGPDGVPVTVGELGSVQLGAAQRRGMLDENGRGEVVGGIVVMRYGENALAVIQRVKAKLAELEKGLPADVAVHVDYDRSSLIDRAVDTLKHSLLEEGLIVSLVIGLFLLHFRSALVIVLSIPVAVLMAFILMHLLGISSNIMSLGGVAIAVGVLVDAAIVMVENAYRHLAEPGDATRDVTQTIIDSAKQVGRPIFFSLLIILLSFSPVFLLTGQEGKLFHPLAATKSFSMAAAALLSITLVPVLMTFLLRGRLKPEQQNPVSRLFIAAYRPVLGLALRFKQATLAIALLVLVLAVPLARSIGSEFMPPLDEGSLLFMPTMLPDIDLTEAKRIVQEQDRILASFPEVANVLGKVGRADTATDPSPVSMVETIVTLKPRREWPDPRLSKDALIAKLDARLQIPGVSNGWTQPIINRINMLSTGVRTDLGLKIYGSNLQTIEDLGIQAGAILEQVPGAADVYANRVVGGRYVNIVPNRWAIARYGLSEADVQQAIGVAIGGMVVTNTVEGRDRFPVRVRYARDFRADPSTLGQVLVPTSSGAQIPLSELADITVSDGPPMISSENALLSSIVYLNVRGRDMGSFVQAATTALDKHLKLPPGYYYDWSGQYQNQLHAQRRLAVVVPLAIAIILLLLYFTFRNWIASLLVVLSVPFALVGGLVLQKLLGYNFSVAVWVGYIALAGIAVETGVVMLIYLNEALDRHLARGELDERAIHDATVEGAVLRLRPKLMTVFAALLGLLPIMWSRGAGSDVMRPIATPMLGGLVTSTLLVLVVLPVLFALWKTRALKRGTLAPSGGHTAAPDSRVGVG